MLKADTRLRRALLVLAIWQLAIISPLTITLMLTGLSLGSLLTALIGYGIFSFLFFGEIRRAISAIRRLRRGEQRRQAAVVHSPGVFLTWPQPVPYPAALPLPYTIWFRPKRVSYLGLLLLALLVLAFWIVRIGWWHALPDPLSSLGVALAVVYGLAEILSLPQRIEVSASGMTVCSLFRRQTLSWQEARLFAVDVLAKDSQPANHYELSSATTSLRWSRKLKPSRFTALSSPFPVYAQHMEALLSLIAGQTGLPLYDLRDSAVPRVASAPAHVAIAQE